MTSYGSSDEQADARTKAQLVRLVGKGKLWSKIVFGGIVALILLFGSWGTIGTGERGVHLRMSAFTGKVIGEGLYFKLPLLDRVVPMDVKVHKEEMETSAASHDLQTVTTKVALNLRLIPEKVGEIYQSIGLGYKDNVVAPIFQESVKSVTANYTAEELITKREIVRQQTEQLIREKLLPRGIAIDSFNILNFSFSPSFEQAIEAKVTAEQHALAAKNKLEQIKPWRRPGERRKPSRLRLTL